MMKTEKERNRVYRLIPLENIRINPDQPRKFFDVTDLEGLASSIRQYGVIQPLTVAYTGEGNYLLVAGERRYRACKMAGLGSVPCLVTDGGEEENALLSLIENIQRKDLNFFEEAVAIRAVMNRYGLTQSEIASRLGKTQATVANKLRLLRIPVPLQEEILRRGFSERHARALLRFPPCKMEEALGKAVSENLSVTEFESFAEISARKRIAEESGEKNSPLRHARGCIGDIRICFNTIERAVRMIRDAGLNADRESKELEDRYICTITIMK